MIINKNLETRISCDSMSSIELESKYKMWRRRGDMLVGKATIAYRGPAPILFLTSSTGAGIGAVAGYVSGGPAGAIVMGLTGALIGTLIGLAIEALIQMLLRT